MSVKSKQLVMDSDVMEIMLVEDDEVDVMTVQRAFAKNSIANPLHVANDGMEALEKLSKMIEGNEVIPQIILLDINMPRMNGIEFLGELRKNEKLKHISVFVLTTSNNDEDMIQAYDMNVAGYIVKPVSFEKFLDAVNVLSSFWDLIDIPGVVKK